MSDSSTSSSSLTRAALATGTALAGAYAGLSLAKWVYRRELPAPLALPPALDLETRTFEAPGGRVQYYARPGTGTPFVLLHSFNAAASSHEMKPIAEHLVATTDRPVYALDWLGFGRSARRPIDYTPALYEQQLYHFLTEKTDAPADLIALSLGGEYAAKVTLQAAPLVRRLVLLSPTGLSASRTSSRIGRLGLSLAAKTGAFELLFYRLTRRSSLRDFYARQVFLDPDAVPDALLSYAETTAHVRGAHRAPLRFLDRSLFLEDVDTSVYAHLYRPTLLLTPETPASTIQSFDRLPALLYKNPRDLTHQTLPGGLLPHWEAPSPFFEVLDTFIETD